MQNKKRDKRKIKGTEDTINEEGMKIAKLADTLERRKLTVQVKKLQSFRNKVNTKSRWKQNRKNYQIDIG